jgi:hypothetical protein
MVFGNTVLWRIFGPKRDEVMEEWRKLLIEELNDMYFSPNSVLVIKSRTLRWPEHLTCMGQRRGAYRVVVKKPEGKGPLGRPRHRWEYNIEMDLCEEGWGGMDWIDLAEYLNRWQAVVYTVMNLQVP